VCSSDLDFRSAPPPTAAPLTGAPSPAGSAGAPAPAAPPPGQFGASAASGANDPILAATQPNPAGTVIYYRME